MSCEGNCLQCGINCFRAKGLTPSSRKLIPCYVGTSEGIDTSYGRQCGYGFSVGQIDVGLKPLFFAAPFPRGLFTGEKTKTFRITGGDYYSPDDLISLQVLGELRPLDAREFATARVVSKVRKTFAELSETDWQGHEIFNSPEEMYRIYSAWEGCSISASTSLDILSYDQFQITNPTLVNLCLEQLAQSQPKCIGEGQRFPFPYIDPSSPNYNPYKQGGNNPDPHMRC